MMNTRWTWMALALAAGTVRADLPGALERFSDYQPGQPKKVLHETRLAAMRDCDQPGVRTAHEQALLEFVQSGASVAARREACLWLGRIGTRHCLPVLAKLAAREEFADVASIAARDIKGGTVTTVAGTHDLAGFRAAVEASDRPADLLVEAIGGGHDGLARLACGLAAEGRGAREVAKWLGEALAGLPAGRQLLVLNTVGGIEAAAIGRLARTGEGEVRLAAVRRLAEIGGEQAAAFLREILGAGNPAGTEAAHAALVLMDEAVVRPFLIEGLGSSEASAQAWMIGIAVERGAEFAAGRLWEIAGAEGGPNQGAAIRALGRVAPTGDFGRLLEAYVAGDGKPRQQDYQAAVFEMALRQPDYGEALRTIETASATAPPKAAAALRAMAGKLDGLRPGRTLKEVRNPQP